MKKTELCPKKPCLEESSSSSSTKLKTVRFNLIRSRALIPTRNEYYEEGIEKDLWWTEVELQKNEREIDPEVRAFMEKHPTLSVKTAARAVYHPKFSEK